MTLPMAIDAMQETLYRYKRDPMAQPFDVFAAYFHIDHGGFEVWRDIAQRRLEVVCKCGLIAEVTYRDLEMETAKSRPLGVVLRALHAATWRDYGDAFVMA